MPIFCLAQYEVFAETKPSTRDLVHQRSGLQLVSAWRVHTKSRELAWFTVLIPQD